MKLFSCHNATHDHFLCQDWLAQAPTKNSNKMTYGQYGMAAGMVHQSVIRINAEPPATEDMRSDRNPTSMTIILAASC